MKRAPLTAVLAAALIALATGCGARAGDESPSIQPTETELLDIDTAATTAAEEITPESANDEFEKLKAELGAK